MTRVERSTDDWVVEHGSPPSAAPVFSGELVGRVAELRLLVDKVMVPPAVVVVEGEAGIGKTRLMAELGRQPNAGYRRWLSAGCSRIREPLPLGPIIEALRSMGEILRGSRLSPVVGALRPLLPELDGVLPLAPEPLGDRAAERHRVFRALAEILDTMGPAVLILEDPIPTQITLDLGTSLQHRLDPRPRASLSHRTNRLYSVW